MKSPYPTYKPTPLPWMPKVPEHWDDVKVKFLFKERVEKGFEDEPLLAATQTQGVVPKELYETRTVTAQKDFHLLKLVEVGDFVISLRSFQGGIEYAHYRGIISPAYTVMKPLPQVDGGYFRHLFKSKQFVNDLATYVTGIREGQNIDYGKFRDSYQPLPPLPEQRQIAAFLDHKCGLIDTFIQKKTRLIELLKEQKQAIINKAVTRGLDDRVRLKPSGIEWLGEVPEHWEVKKLKHVARMQNGLALNEKNVPANNVSVPYLRVANVQDGYIDLTEVKEVRISPEQIERYSLEKGDLLMNEGGDFDKLGRGVVWEGQISPCIHQNHVYALKVSKNRDPYWINLLTLTFYGKCYFISKSKKTTNLASISSKNIMEFPVLMPPENEVNEIKKFVEEEEMRVGAIITRIEREIELMQEYKTTLIAEAVTGRIDVREWQTHSKLPTQAAHATH